MLALSPLLFLVYWLLLGLLAVALVAYRRVAWVWSAATWVAATGVCVVGLLIWLGQRLLLPLVVVLPRWSAMLPVPHWAWQMDGVGWELSGLLLGMVTAVCLALWHAQDDTPGLPIVILLLLLAGLATIWADTLPSLMAGWLLLTAAWFAVLAAVRGQDGVGWPLRLKRVAWHLLALFGLWLVGILVSLNGSESLVVGGGNPVVTTIVLLVVLAQMGVWPLHGWRPRYAPLPLPIGWSPVAWSPVAWLLNTVPPLMGVVTLVRLVVINEAALDTSLAFTAVGLLGSLVGVVLLWRDLGQRERAVEWVALALAGQAFLVGLWGGVAALQAATYGLVAATGILFLLAGRPPRRGLRGWRLVAPLLALGTVGAVPLLPGFVAQVQLYEGWLTNGAGVLVLFGMLLHLLLITAVYQLIRGDEGEVEEVPLAGLDKVDVAVGLLAVGLVVNGRWAAVTQLGQMQWLAWVTVLVTLVTAGVLARFLRQEQLSWFSWRDVVPLTERVWWLLAQLVQLARTGLAALKDGLVILEGETGLLWLLALLLLFLLF